MLTEPILFTATTDAARARHFYENVLGLTFVSDSPYSLVFKSGVHTLRIQKVTQVILAPYTSLGWRVPDLKTELRRLTNHGVRFERYPGLIQDGEGIWTAPGGARVAWFKDPDGHTLSLVESAEII